MSSYLLCKRLAMAEGLPLSFAEALIDCDNFSHGTYQWRPATMKKLADRGYVEAAGSGYALNERGRTALAAAKAEAP